jgi:hypothetical protein
MGVCPESSHCAIKTEIRHAVLAHPYPNAAKCADGTGIQI